MAEEFFDSLDIDDYDYDGEDDSQGSQDGGDFEDEESEEGEDSKNESGSNSQNDEDNELDQDQENENPSNGKDSDESNEEKNEKKDLTDSINRYKPSKPVYDEFEPSCETDDSFRQNEMQLLDDKCKEYVYIQIPSVKNLKNVITPAKRVQEQLHAYYSILFYSFSSSSSLYSKNAFFLSFFFYNFLVSITSAIGVSPFNDSIGTLNCL